MQAKAGRQHLVPTNRRPADALLLQQSESTRAPIMRQPCALLWQYQGTLDDEAERSSSL